MQDDPDLRPTAAECSTRPLDGRIQQFRKYAGPKTRHIPYPESVEPHKRRTASSKTGSKSTGKFYRYRRGLNY